MDAHSLLLWAHIVSGFVILGPLILFDMVVPGLLKARNAAAARWVSQRMERLGPATLVIALLGVALVLRTGDDPYGFDTGWVMAALGVYVLLVANGVGNLSRLLRRAADRLEAGEDADAEAGQLRIFGTLNIILFLAMVWLMVDKPDF